MKGGKDVWRKRKQKPPDRRLLHSDWYRVHEKRLFYHFRHEFGTIVIYVYNSVVRVRRVLGVLIEYPGVGLRLGWCSM